MEFLVDSDEEVEGPTDPGVEDERGASDDVSDEDVEGPTDPGVEDEEGAADDDSATDDAELAVAGSDEASMEEIDVAG